MGPSYPPSRSSVTTVPAVRPPPTTTTGAVVDGSAMGLSLPRAAARPRGARRTPAGKAGRCSAPDTPRSEAEGEISTRQPRGGVRRQRDAVAVEPRALAGQVVVQ